MRLVPGLLRESPGAGDESAIESFWREESSGSGVGIDSNQHTMLGIPTGLFDHVEVAAFQDAGITGISNLLFFRRSDLDKSRRGATFHIVGIPCKCGSRSFLWISLSCRGSNPVRTGFSFHSENKLKGIWRFPTAGFSTHTASRCRSVYWLSSSLSWCWRSDIRLIQNAKGLSRRKPRRDNEVVSPIQTS